MNWIDFLILLGLALFVFSGFREGLIRQIAGILGLILAFVLAMRFLTWGQGLILHTFHCSSTVAALGAFLVIFFGVLLGVHILAAIVAKVVGSTPLALVDRLGGMGLGLLRGGLILSVVLLLLALCPLPGNVSRALDGSSLARRFRQAGPAIYEWGKTHLPQTKTLFERPLGEKEEHPLPQRNLREGTPRKGGRARV